MIKILVADDHPIYLSGIVSMIESSDDMQVVGTATNGVELVAQCAAKHPQVILTDIRMPQMDGIEATKQIRLTNSTVKIICLSTYSEAELVTEMLQAGANSYLLKSATTDDILLTIREVMVQDHFLNHTMLQIMADRPDLNSTQKVVVSDLTPRELQVLELICRQFTAKQIAVKLDISHRTVEQHKLHLQVKFNVKNSIGLVTYAIKHGIVKMKE